MALTPYQAAQLTIEEIKAVKRYESMIDALIRREYTGSMMGRYRFPIEDTPSERIQKVLIEIYETTGWNTSITQGFKTKRWEISLKANADIRLYGHEGVLIEEDQGTNLVPRAESIDIGEDNVEGLQDNSGKKRQCSTDD